MQRQTGTQDSSQNNAVGDLRNSGNTQRRGHILGCVVEALAYLHRHEFTYAFNITAETQRITLDVHIANLGDELVENTVVLR